MNAMRRIGPTRGPGCGSSRYSREQAFADLIARAVPEPVVVRGVELRRGEALVSLRDLARAWGWSYQTVRRVLSDAQGTGRLRARRVTLGIVVDVSLSGDFGVIRSENVTLSSPIDRAAADAVAATSGLPLKADTIAEWAVIIGWLKAGLTEAQIVEVVAKLTPDLIDPYEGNLSVPLLRSPLAHRTAQCAGTAACAHQVGPLETRLVRNPVALSRLQPVAPEAEGGVGAGVGDLSQREEGQERGEVAAEPRLPLESRHADGAALPAGAARPAPFGERRLHLQRRGGVAERRPVGGNGKAHPACKAGDAVADARHQGGESGMGFRPIAEKERGLEDEHEGGGRRGFECGPRGRALGLADPPAPLRRSDRRRGRRGGGGGRELRGEAEKIEGVDGGSRPPLCPAQG